MKRLTVVVLIAIIMVFLYGQIQYTVAPYKNWDLASYRAMAQAAPGIASDVCQPPAYRLFGPYLAGLLPVADPIAFYALSVFASIVLAVLAFYFFRLVGLSPWTAVITVALFTFNRFWFGLTVWDFFQLNDLLSLIWIVILFIAMLKDRWLLFGVTFFLSVLTRETGLLMIPVVFVYLWENKSLGGKWKTAFGSMLPGIAAFLLVRILVPAPCGKPLFEQLAAHSISILSPEKFLRLAISSYAPFSLLPFVFLGLTVAYFRTRWYALVFVVLVFLSTLFGATFDERLMAPAFVVLYALIGLTIDDRRDQNAYVAVLLLGGFLASLHHSTARFELPGRTWTLALTLGSLALVTTVALFFRLKRPQRESRPPD